MARYNAYRFASAVALNEPLSSVTEDTGALKADGPLIAAPHCKGEGGKIGADMRGRYREVSTETERERQ